MNHKMVQATMDINLKKTYNGVVNLKCALYHMLDIKYANISGGLSHSQDMRHVKMTTKAFKHLVTGKGQCPVHFP
jgi:hypothetical protein